MENLASRQSALANDFRKLKDPTPVIPGRPFDFVMNQQPRDKRAWQALRELEEVKSELGGIDLMATADANDILIFNGSDWVAQDRTTFFQLEHMTDVAMTGSPSANQFLRHNGSTWTNQTVALVTALDDLSDVVLTAPATGAFLVKSATNWVDQNFTSARLGIGTTGDPTHRLELEDGDHTAWFTGSGSLGSTAAGFRMSKTKTQTGEALGVAFASDGASDWELMMAADTNNALRSGFGNADFGLWDYSAGAGGGFALRISPEEAASSGTGTKFFFGRSAATPRAFTSYVTVQSPAAALIAQAVRAHASQTANLQEWQDSSGAVQLAVAANGRDFVLDTATGSQIGTGATEKHALWGKTPIVQPTALTAADNTAIDATYDATEQAVLDNVRTRLNELETRLTDWGFLA